MTRLGLGIGTNIGRSGGGAPSVAETLRYGVSSPITEPQPPFQRRGFRICQAIKRQAQIGIGVFYKCFHLQNRSRSAQRQRLDEVYKSPQYTSTIGVNTRTDADSATSIYRSAT